MKTLRITASLAAVIFVISLLPLLAQNAPTPAPTPMPMGGMMSNGMMESCQKNFQTMGTTLADLAKTVADAKKTNDGALPAATVDQLEAALAKMQGNMKECQGTMEHMHQMMSTPDKH